LPFQNATNLYHYSPVAIDASMHIYQFLMVIGRSGDQTLTNDAGEVTSHLQGMFMVGLAKHFCSFLVLLQSTHQLTTASTGHVTNLLQHPQE
jgi:hypothetical protein